MSATNNQSSSSANRSSPTPSSHSDSSLGASPFDFPFDFEDEPSFISELLSIFPTLDVALTPAQEAAFQAIDAFENTFKRKFVEGVEKAARTLKVEEDEDELSEVVKGEVRALLGMDESWVDSVIGELREVLVGLYGGRGGGGEGK